ncbi:MAG: chromate transporter [Coprobacillus sp.]|nr:chromate transporter [Coprobacillus sp.]
MKREKSKGKGKLLGSLFWTFFKIGLFTFGGGAAMIPMIKTEVVEKKGWLGMSDILNIIAVAESTPGPIAINTSTYVGYKVAGAMGAALATLGCALPSFIIILIISFFYEAFMKFTPVINAFKGLNVAVILLLAIAVINLWKEIPHNAFTLVLFIVGFISYVLLSWFNLTFRFISLVFILFGLVIGILFEAYKVSKEKKKA